MARIPETSYERYLASDHWYAMRLKRIRFALQANPPQFIDTVHCNGCKRFVWLGAVHVHHRNYERVGKERITDLEVLCAGCHADHHGLETPDWYKEANERQLQMVSEAFVKKYRGQIKRLGSVIAKCLEQALCLADVAAYNEQHSGEAFREIEVMETA